MLIEKGLERARYLRERLRSFRSSIAGGAPHGLLSARSRVGAGDNRVRRWRLVDPGCFEGLPRWVPSPQLMADILLSAKPAGWKELRAQLEQGTALDCAEAANTGAPGPERLKYHCLLP